MKLLLHPQIGIGEGPTGYLRRLADTNRISLGDLKRLGFAFGSETLQRFGCVPATGQNAVLDQYVCRLLHALADPRVAWITRVGRFCPVCLTDNPRWRVGWELQFCDVCPEHKVWLIDTCECGHLVLWDRREFRKCDCGRALTNVRPTECPEAVSHLSALLIQKLLGNDHGLEFEISKQLTLPQLQRLIRFLGTYGDTQPGPRPQKITFQDRLVVSWQITSLAAEILANWPISLYRILDRLYREHADEGGGRLTGRFGFLYTALYKAFPEDEYSPLRDAFENYLAEHWRGALGERNRRLPPKFLDRVSWIPANHACRKLAVSKSRLTALIAENCIAAESRAGLSGRTFLVVRREDVEQQLNSLANEVDLRAAARMLGVTKRRMLALRPWLFPEAYKTTTENSPWAIPRRRLDVLTAIIGDTQIESTLPKESTSLSHVMKYWAWSDQALAAALTDVIARRLVPIGVLKAEKGIAGLIFKEKEIRDWHGRTQQETTRGLTIPEAAMCLQIKQEVAYALVRSGFLSTVFVAPGGMQKEGQRVTQAALAAFGDQYIFARDLAKSIGRSPKALIENLASLGVTPVCGPHIDGCRQVLYENRSELKNAMGVLRHVHLVRNKQSR